MWAYRRTGGKVGDRAKGGRLVLLLTVGAGRSGLQDTVPVACVGRDGEYYPAQPQGASRRSRSGSATCALLTATIKDGRDRRIMSVEVVEQS